MKITLTLDVTPEQLSNLFKQQDVLMGPVKFDEESEAPAAYRTPKKIKNSGRPGRPHALSPEGYKKLWKMHLDGSSLRTIAKELGVAKRTVERSISRIKSHKRGKV